MGHRCSPDELHIHPSLLAHVASDLPQKENLATAALAYILNRSSGCRERVSALLSRIGGGECGGLVRVRTEEGIEGGGRPDVRLIGQDGALLGFVEVKFWAGLTENQPVGYLEALQQHPGAMLVVLAPERRMAALREELQARCLDAGLESTRESDTLLRCGGVRLALMSWSFLLHELSAAAQGNAGSAGDVEQLRGLCSMIDEEGNFSMTSEELSDVRGARRTRQLNLLVDEVVGALTAGGLAGIKGLNRTPRPWGYGRYVSLPHAVAWIGNDNYSWGHFGRGPLWLVFLPEDVQRLGLQPALRDWLEGSPAKAYVDEQDGRVLLPLPLTPGAVKGELVLGLVGFVNELVARLDAAGVVRAGDV